MTAQCIPWQELKKLPKVTGDIRLVCGIGYWVCCYDGKWRAAYGDGRLRWPFPEASVLLPPEPKAKSEGN